MEKISAITKGKYAGCGAIRNAALFKKATTDVDPINIQVNGKVFQPKDANGNDVAVFAYNGTTYAAVRALAEAYGLTVGYDASSNMATVTPAGDTSKTAPQAGYGQIKGTVTWQYNDFGNTYI